MFSSILETSYFSTLEILKVYLFDKRCVYILPTCCVPLIKNVYTFFLPAELHAIPLQAYPVTPPTPQAPPPPHPQIQ